MRKYQWIVIIALIGCMVSFASCQRLDKMVAPVVADPEPEVETIEPVIPEVETVEPVIPDTQTGDASMLTNSLIIAEATVVNAPVPESSNSPTAPQIKGNLPEVTASVGSIILLPFEYSGTNTLAGCIVYIPGVAAYYEIPYTGAPDDLPSVIPVSLSENVSTGSFIQLCYGVYDNQGQTSNFLNTLVTVETEMMAPKFTEGNTATRAIAENTQSDVNIGTPIAATDSDSNVLTYTLSGPDASAFSIDSTTGQLRTKSALDYETESTYTLTITVSDGSLSDIINVTVNVTDMADDAVSGIFSHIYWTDSWDCKIQRSNLSGSNVEDLVPQVCPAHIAIDVTGGKMYWTESTLFSKIRRANLDGSNVEDLVTQNRNTAPELSGIALDIAGDKMYWVDGRKIQRANLNGTDIEDLVLLPEDRTHWADIALDVARDKLYWADGDKLYRVNLDGSNIQQIHDLWTINSVAVDVVGGKIYYSDGSNIRYSDLDGSNRESISISGSRGTVVEDIALDVAGGKAYWVGAAHHVGEGILSVNLDGTNMQLLVTTEAEEVRAPNSIDLGTEPFSFR